MRFATPDEAETAFYRAFQRQDLGAMMDVWAADSDIVCVHPGGQPLKGTGAVRASWEQIFENGPALTFLVEERQRIGTDELVLHVVHEHIRVGTSGEMAQVAATNGYRRTPQGWRMILHHASPAPSAHVPGAVH